LTAHQRTTNPDAALSRWLARESRLRRPRAAKVSFAQGTKSADRCGNGCKKGSPRPAVVRDPQTGMVEHPIRYADRCTSCNAEWPRVSVESGKSRRRPREVVRVVDDSGPLADLIDLDLAVARPPAGFSKLEWEVHLGVWSAKVHGLGYDESTDSFRGSLEDIVDAFAPLLERIGREGSPRTMQRMIRVARDIVESRLIEQIEGDDAAQRRRLAARSRLRSQRGVWHGI